MAAGGTLISVWTSKEARLRDFDLMAQRERCEICGVCFVWCNEMRKRRGGSSHTPSGLAHDLPRRSPSAPTAPGPRTRGPATAIFLRRLRTCTIRWWNRSLGSRCARLHCLQSERAAYLHGCLEAAAGATAPIWIPRRERRVDTASFCLLNLLLDRSRAYCGAQLTAGSRSGSRLAGCWLQAPVACRVLLSELLTPQRMVARVGCVSRACWFPSP